MRSEETIKISALHFSECSPPLTFTSYSSHRHVQNPPKCDSNVDQIQPLLILPLSRSDPFLVSPICPFQSMLASSSFVFLNTDPLFDFPRPTVHKVVEIGGISVDCEPKGLDEVHSLPRGLSFVYYWKIQSRCGKIHWISSSRIAQSEKPFYCTSLFHCSSSPPFSPSVIAASSSVSAQSPPAFSCQTRGNSRS